jgi:quercetin dioxygenase-like cupin family protein
MDLQFFGGDEDSGRVFVVETKIDAGYLIESHKHRHAHTSILVSGTADVTIDGVTTRMTGYKLVTIPKDTTHSIAAVTDVIWLCLWADDEVSNEEAKEALELVKNFNELGV